MSLLHQVAIWPLAAPPKEIRVNSHDHCQVEQRMAGVSTCVSGLVCMMSLMALAGGTNNQELLADHVTDRCRGVPAIIQVCMQSQARSSLRNGCLVDGCYLTSPVSPCHAVDLAADSSKQRGDAEDSLGVTGHAPLFGWDSVRDAGPDNSGQSAGRMVVGASLVC